MQIHNLAYLCYRILEFSAEQQIQSVLSSFREQSSMDYMDLSNPLLNTLIVKTALESPGQASVQSIA